MYSEGKAPTPQKSSAPPPPVACLFKEQGVYSATECGTEAATEDRANIHTFLSCHEIHSSAKP